MKDAIAALKRYVNLPSGSYDRTDAIALAQALAEDFVAAGLQVTQMPGQLHGPTLVCRWGQGPRQLMLMGHYDTVFPHARMQPFRLEGGIAYGSGAADMKGGLVVMLHSLKEVLPNLDPAHHSIVAVLNGDEEVGSPESRQYILKTAEQSIAAFSFEPGGDELNIERKGVTAFTLTATGKGGHAGSQYKSCHSAVQGLCEVVGRLYTLRDDERDVSLNIGVIEGGTAENVVADRAVAKGEFRTYDPQTLEDLRGQVRACCDSLGVPGVTVDVAFGATHPACKRTEGSLKLFEQARAMAEKQGRRVALRVTGGAGDISFAAQAGIPVLDGFGLPGKGFHTDQEQADISMFSNAVALAAGMIAAVLKADN